MGRKREHVFCGDKRCCDRLRRTEVLRARLVGAGRMGWSVRIEYRHTTRRWDGRYRPDLLIVTRAGLLRQWHRARARAV